MNECSGVVDFFFFSLDNGVVVRSDPKTHMIDQFPISFLSFLSIWIDTIRYKRTWKMYLRSLFSLLLHLHDRLFQRIGLVLDHLLRRLAPYSISIRK